jgi:hypothetical protein
MGFWFNLAEIREIRYQDVTKELTAGDETAVSD